MRKDYNSYLVQYCIEHHLKEMFYRIPEVKRHSGTTRDSFSFKMNTCDAKCLSGATIKKWISAEFDMAGLAITAKKYKEVGFGKGDYGYEFYIEISKKEV